MTLGLIRPSQAVPRPPSPSRLVDLSGPEVETSAEDRLPAWSSWGVGAQPADDRVHGPTSAFTEHMLSRAYANTAGRDQATDRVEPCACGGSIEARDVEGAIAAAVRLHNASTRHEAWARAQGMR